MKKRSVLALLCALLLLLPLCGCDALTALAYQALQTGAATPAPQESFESLLLDPAASPEETATPTPTQAVADEETPAEQPADPVENTPAIDEHGAYTERDDVALYLYVYGHLPENFITKSEARALGWSGGGLDSYDYGKCIGGDRFGNNEGLLPEKSGRVYYECDIGTLHKSSRGAKRIVFSNDGLIYYTGDHYESFTLLYGEE